jgi:hypothetical protein
MQIRADLIAVHDRAWRRLAAPGTWWTGAERVKIASEARTAHACRLCRRRLEAISPAAARGAHDAATDLSPAMVDVVHRICTDSPRLTKAWLDGVLGPKLSDAHYVELIGVVATVTAVDSFRRALDLAPWPLPVPLPGEPTRHRPVGAKPGLAWVPTVAPEDIAQGDPQIYRGKSGANIHRAMSLVPAEVEGFFDLDDVMYLPDALLRDFGHEHRALTHAQIELLAARVSALNRCVY